MISSNTIILTIDESNQKISLQLDDLDISFQEIYEYLLENNAVKYEYFSQ